MFNLTRRALFGTIAAAGMAASLAVPAVVPAVTARFAAAFSASVGPTFATLLLTATASVARAALLTRAATAAPA